MTWIPKARNRRCMFEKGEAFWNFRKFISNSHTPFQMLPAGETLQSASKWDSAALGPLTQAGYYQRSMVSLVTECQPGRFLWDTACFLHRLGLELICWGSCSSKEVPWSSLSLKFSTTLDKRTKQKGFVSSCSLGSWHWLRACSANRKTPLEISGLGQPLIEPYNLGLLNPDSNMYFQNVFIHLSNLGNIRESASDQPPAPIGFLPS